MAAPADRAWLLLGSNVDPERNLPRAVAVLAARLEILRSSPVYVGPATGGRPQADYHNAALLVATDLGPRRLKEVVLYPVEAQLGRVRDGDRYAPRSIDIDLCLYNRDVVDGPDLVLPDPEILTRAHVVVPLADLDPEYVHPVDGRTLAAIAAPFREAGDLRARPDLSLSRCAAVSSKGAGGIDAGESVQ